MRNRRALVGFATRGLMGVSTSVALLLVAWWALATILDVQFLPSPWDVAIALEELVGQGDLQAALWATIPSLLTGLVLACLAGVCIGLIMGTASLIDRLTIPWVYIFWATPPVALLPLVIIVFGIGVRAAAAYVFISSVFPVIMNARSGAKHTDPKSIEVARSLGAGRRQILTEVVLPASIPSIVAGLRIAVGRAVVAIIIAQLFITVTGLGALLQRYGQMMQFAHYFAPLIIAIALGVFLNWLSDWSESKIVRWRF